MPVTVTVTVTVTGTGAEGSGAQPESLRRRLGKKTGGSVGGAEAMRLGENGGGGDVYPRDRGLGFERGLLPGFATHMRTYKTEALAVTPLADLEAGLFGRRP
jgi:hypothetical protein